MALSTDQFPKVLHPVFRWFRIDFTPLRQPSKGEVLFATLVAIVGSLLVDALLVKVGTTVFPSTTGYVHFRFLDYSRLTVIGVVIACAGWPIVTRVSSTPRWLFLRLAVMVSAVLLLPDAAIWYLGAPVDAVFVLVWMHFAIAFVTYQALVNLAPVRRGRHAR